MSTIHPNTTMNEMVELCQRLHVPGRKVATEFLKVTYPTVFRWTRGQNKAPWVYNVAARAVIDALLELEEEGLLPINPATPKTWGQSYLMLLDRVKDMVIDD